MNPEISKKILEFESGVQDVLRPDLEKLSNKLDQKNEELAEYIQLKSIIKTLQDTIPPDEGFKTKVDIGSNFLVQAHVDDTSHIILNIGLGHFLEFTLDDALIYIDVRIKLFESMITNLRKEIAKTNAFIKYFLIGINELKGL